MPHTVSIGADGFPVRLSDAALTASTLYRRAEADAFARRQAQARAHIALAHNPDLERAAKAAWARVQDAVAAAFVLKIPALKRHRDRGDGPKVYEVHHTLEVARQCFLLALLPEDAHTAANPDEAAAFALRRVGVDGDPETFFLTTPAPV